MSTEGRPQQIPKPIDPNEHHFRLVGKEREAEIARLMQKGLNKEQAEIQLLSIEVVADHNFLESEKKKRHQG